VTRSKRGAGRFGGGALARSAAPVGAFPSVHRTVLPNGATVLAAHTPVLHSATVATYFRVGSRHESSSRNGVSHFVEHILFRGSHGYPDTRAMNAAVEAVGGSLNALTARDHTCLFTPVHPSGVGVAVDVLADLARRPLFRDVDVERQVILEEILDEVDARGRDVDPDNLVKRRAFLDHGLGQKIAGTRGTVAGLRRAEVREHHARHYVGSNAVLVVAGPIPPGEVVEMARGGFGALPAGPRTPSHPPPPWPEGPIVTTVEHDDAQVEFTLAFPGTPERHRDHPAALVLRRMLDDGLSSRLPFEIVERQGLAYSIHAGLEAFEDAGIFTVEGACSPPRLERVVSEVLRVLSGICEEPPDADELRRVQERHRVSMVFALDSPMDLVGWFGMGEVMGAPEALERRCVRVESVRPADVRRVARATFRRRGLVAVAVGPDAAGMRRAIRRAVDRARLP
jgi:predicted Zn-dependent peptidase